MTLEYISMNQISIAPISLAKPGSVARNVPTSSEAPLLADWDRALLKTLNTLSGGYFKPPHPIVGKAMDWSPYNTVVLRQCSKAFSSSYKCPARQFY